MLKLVKKPEIPKGKGKVKMAPTVCAEGSNQHLAGPGLYGKVFRHPDEARTRSFTAGTNMRITLRLKGSETIAVALSIRDNSLYDHEIELTAAQWKALKWLAQADGL